MNSRRSDDTERKFSPTAASRNNKNDPVSNMWLSLRRNEKDGILIAHCRGCRKVVIDSRLDENISRLERRMI